MTLRETVPARGPRWANRLAIVVVVLSVLGPLAVVGIRAEVASWHAARGVDAAWDGRAKEAITHYDNALAWDPYRAGFYTLRAKAYLELERPAQAVADARQATELAPAQEAAAHVYTTALLRDGQGKQAADFYEEQLPYLGIYDDGRRAGLQNNIAAILATANIELDRALKHIEAALKFAPNQAYFIDTRAMVLYRKGEFAKALIDAQKAIGNPAQASRAVEVAVSNLSADDRHRAYQVREGHRGIAQLLYHRALIHEALATQAKDDLNSRITHQIQAVADRQRIRDLGFVPNETLF